MRQFPVRAVDENPVAATTTTTSTAPRASRPACTSRSTRRPAPSTSPAPATRTRWSGWPTARRSSGHTAGGLPLGVEAGHRLPHDPPRPGARRNADAVHRRAHRDRRARPGHRVGPAARGLGERTRPNRLEELADRWCGPCTAPPRTTPPAPLADRREDDIAVLLLRRDPDGPTAGPPRRTALTRRPGRARADRGRPPAAARAAARLGGRRAGRLRGADGLRDGHQRPRPHGRGRPARRGGRRASTAPAGCASRSPTPATRCRTSGAPANWPPAAAA